MDTDMQLEIYHYLIHDCRLDPDEAWCTISDIEADIEADMDYDDIWDIVEAVA